MNRFLDRTISDIHGGRLSWRVLFAFCAPSFALAIAVGLLG